MQSKKLITTIAVVVIVGAGAFFGGTVYEKDKLSSQGMLQSAAQSANGGQRGQGGQGGGPGGARMMGQGGPGGNNGAGDFAAGQIISKDDKSITIKTRNGGSQIVYFSDSTSIGKSTEGSSADLSNGEQVTANGKNNTDGSLAASNIQIRPADQQAPQQPPQ